MYLENDYRQFKEATRQLKQAIERNPNLSRQFTQEQLNAINQEKDRIPGFTWHHHQEPGKMQLVPTRIHGRTGHTGGRDIWGGGNAYR
jgi:DNase/tRNase domain of colicin-like bacteriocin